LELTLATFRLNKSIEFQAESPVVGVFDVLKMFVDSGVLTCWEPRALNRFEEVDCIVSTAEDLRKLQCSYWTTVLRSFQDRIGTVTFG